MIKNAQWHKNMQPGFVPDSLQTTSNQFYDISIELTNNNQYRYQNIWLLVNQSLETGVMKMDTVEIKISDENGKWLGSGVGGLHQVTYPFKQRLRLDSTKQYLIYLQQYMIDDPLNGIEKVGIKIQESL